MAYRVSQTLESLAGDLVTMLCTVQSMVCAKEEDVAGMMESTVELAEYLRLRITISEESHAQYRPPKDIPLGILKAIFLYAVAPDFLLDPSLGSGPESPWCQALRMSKSFVAVNKSWNAVGTPFLYEHIVLRRVGQVVALRRTLHESTNNLAALVKSLDVRCYVPEDYKALFDKSMLMIFQQCNGLSSFTFNAFSNFRSPIRLVPLDTLQQLTHFSYGDTVRPTDIFDQLPLLSGRLTSLVLPPLLELDGVSLDLSFPSLRRLEVYATPSLAMLLAKNWMMPGLEELIVRYRYSFASMDPDFTHVFRAHGHSLKYLQFPPEQWQLYQLQNLDELCPNLEHLVVNPLCKIASHPKIKWIDLWLVDGNLHVDEIDIYDRPPRSPDLFDIFRLHQFPSLCGGRWLHTHVSMFRNLPQVLSPSRFDCDYAFDHLGIHLLHRSRQIYTTFPLFKYPVLYDDTTDDELGAGVSEGDESEIPSDPGDTMDGSDQDDDDCGIGYEEALERFSLSLED